MTADLLVPFYCRCALFKVHSFEDGVLSVFLFQFYRSFLKAAFLCACCLFLGLLAFDLFNVVKERKLHNRAGLLVKMNYSKIMSILARAKKVKSPDTDWRLIKVNPSHMESLQKLGLMPAPETPPEKEARTPS